jgi:predicted transcriptional regulator
LIYRLDKEQGNFTQIHNNLINDNKISTTAKAILIYMLSKYDDWNFYEGDIMKHFTDGKTKIKNGIKELIDKRYITRLKVQDMYGRFIYIYNIYEQPELADTED